MTRSFKWHLQFPLNFPFSLLAESWFCVMATLNFWLTFFPTTVCSSGRQLSQFTPVSRDYSSITAVDSRWACSHLSTKPAVLTSTKQTHKKNFSLPSQLCWPTRTNKQTHKHLTDQPVVLKQYKQAKTNTYIALPSQLCWQSGHVARKVACCRRDLSHFRESGLYATTSANTSTSTQAHKHTSTSTQAHCIRQLKHTSTAENSLSPAVISNASALMCDGPIGFIKDQEDSSSTILYKPSPTRSARI